MKSSFSFCGVNIEEFGLNYAPELADTYAYAPGETLVHDEVFDGHDGGYYYGAWRQPKEFRLRCYFENKQIDHGIMANIYELFRVGNSGKLVFSRRPWCYYNVRVSAPIETEFSNYLNGIIVITLKAYYPYARSDMMVDTTDDLQIRTNTAILDSDDKLPAHTFEHITAKETSIILFNPGTEPTPVAISIAGNTSGTDDGFTVGAGFEIHNTTTGQKCKFVNITNELTPAGQGSQENARVICDSLNGKTVRIDNEGNVYSGYLYHQEGFIYLAPAFPINRDIFIKDIYTDTITLYNTLYTNYEGQYIFIQKENKGEWYKIIRQPDSETLVVNRTISNPAATYKTTIARMNELTLTFTGTAGNIRMLDFLYKPAFA